MMEDSPEKARITDGWEKLRATIAERERVIASLKGNRGTIPRMVFTPGVGAIMEREEYGDH